MRLFVWGAGCSAGELVDLGLKPEEICAFIDSFPRQESFMGRPLIRPEELGAGDFDLILVSSRQAESVAAQAEKLGFPPEKLLFLKNNWTLEDRNLCYDMAADVLSQGVIEQTKCRPHAVREPKWLEGSPLTEKDLEQDYVRVRSLETLAGRLEKVPGAAAELGVYRGSFARCINALMPERRLYLFDTFEGFSEAEAAGEAAGLVEAHRHAGMEDIMKLMPHPDKVEIWKGLFPDSLNGLEERFAFVSIDADLEESTLAGLRWFYPRLSHGGYIMLHDWANLALPGVKRALERYEQELGYAVSAVPLCDINGTLVICSENE